MIRENENLEEMMASSMDMEGLPCQSGNKSMKDHLVSTRFESNTIADSTASPSRIRAALLNQNSSGNFDSSHVYMASEKNGAGPIKVV